MKWDILDGGYLKTFGNILQVSKQVSGKARAAEHKFQFDL